MEPLPDNKSVYTAGVVTNCLLLSGDFLRKILCPNIRPGSHSDIRATICKLLWGGGEVLGNVEKKIFEQPQL